MNTISLSYDLKLKLLYLLDNNEIKIINRHVLRYLSLSALSIMDPDFTIESTNFTTLCMFVSKKF